MLRSELPFDPRVRELEQLSRQRNLLTETSEKKQTGEKVLEQRPTHPHNVSLLHRRPEALACLVRSQLEKFHSQSEFPRTCRNSPLDRRRRAHCFIILSVSRFLPHTAARSPSDNKIFISRLQDLHPHEDLSIYRRRPRGSLEACHVFRFARCSILLHPTPAS